MAFNVPFLDLFRGYSASSVTVSCGQSRACRATSGFQQVTGIFPLVQRREILKSSVRCSGKKFAEGSPTPGNQQEVLGIIPRVQKQDFTNTPVIPVYVMLPLGTINTDGELADPNNLINQLKVLKSVNVDGVMVDCWWGIVEGRGPRQYKWGGYKKLFHIVRELKFKLQVVMSFHACGGNVGDNVYIPLPQWVIDIGSENPDIFFTDKEGRRNQECLSWGIDNERILRDRTALECYDKYLTKSLEDASKPWGSLFSGQKPEGTGSYNSKPNDTEFFRDGGEFDGIFGRYFLSWYSRVLINHGDQVLAQANRAFAGTAISAKVPGIHWWYKTESHAAELTAGFYNVSNQDGYIPIIMMLKKHNAAMNFTCVELLTKDQSEKSDPEKLVWQVLIKAWEIGIPVGAENALPCFGRQGFNKSCKMPYLAMLQIHTTCVLSLISGFAQSSWRSRISGSLKDS
ncbi:UNVERIFIED_CONTAM: Beta-amylase 2, chloroplastic [Sesamum latifolium]|uniref:Beta-amylase n=1 Tax=Sesamum latifolium TaxID=2727402 RepID=A0AAW2WRX8_9LAMI